MKIIFLDFDGVLNSHRYDMVRLPDEGNIDKTRLPLLKEIIDKTGAKIVLTTSWRKHWNKDYSLCTETGKDFLKDFSQFGIEIFDKTEDFGTNMRPEEVKSWLECHKDIESFVILDDIIGGWDDMSENVVNTSPMILRGLEGKHVEKAIEILNR